MNTAPTQNSDALASYEKEKYEKVWGFDAYRSFSPGEEMVERAVADLGMEEGQTVIDFGCGTGRAAARFAALGYDVIGIDHARNCLDEKVKGQIQFVNNCLWDICPTIWGDWGFCTDVMEHIPPERVDETLDNIKRRTTRGVWFQIATTPDGCGPKLVGEPLHLTVKPPEWWLERLDMRWPGTKLLSHGSNARFVCLN